MRKLQVVRMTIEFEGGVKFEYPAEFSQVTVGAWYKKTQAFVAKSSGSPRGTIFDQHEIHWQDNPRTV